MQTFLPYDNFKLCAEILDYKRLGKQRVESACILNILEGRQKSNAWRNHPAVLMWKGYEEALKLYTNVMILEWIFRGYRNNMPLYNIDINNFKLPYWFGNADLHRSHRNALLYKNYDYYKDIFTEDKPELNYIWPTKDLINAK